ncbi:DUF3967 domain-containing protein [Alteribacter aurantiacus]|uniref:DUF3967 domain-containing protein n=1 Tax=Alteribacter aurantiacus TaxID=254410 RepID=UPI00040C0DBC|nr:DUF3967 domain-containing protein [Alteribacter aurantiacus]
MSESNNYGFFAKEVALKLDIKASTLRQWALALEEEGYKFERNDKEQRIYYDRDISMFFELKKLIEKKRSRGDAIKAVAKLYKDRENAEKTLSVIDKKHDNQAFMKEDVQKFIDEAVERAFKKGKEQGKQEVKELLNKVDERLENRDRQLMEGLRELQEEKKLLAAAAEEEAKRRENEKKGFWSKLFGSK